VPRPVKRAESPAADQVVPDQFRLVVSQVKLADPLSQVLSAAAAVPARARVATTANRRHRCITNSSARCGGVTRQTRDGHTAQCQYGGCRASLKALGEFVREYPCAGSRTAPGRHGNSWRPPTCGGMPEADGRPGANADVAEPSVPAREAGAVRR